MTEAFSIVTAMHFDLYTTKTFKTFRTKLNKSSR